MKRGAKGNLTSLDDVLELQCIQVSFCPVTRELPNLKMMEDEEPQM